MNENGMHCATELLHNAQCKCGLKCETGTNPEFKFGTQEMMVVAKRKKKTRRR